MATVPVVYKGKTKLVSVSLESFQKLQHGIRGRFRDIPDGEIAIQAKVNGDGTKYNVDDDEDLEEVKNKLETLYIRSLSVGPEAALTKVMVAGEYYSIDQIPSRDSSIVQRMIEEFKTDVDNIDAVSLDTRLGNLCDVADLFQLAATAGNTRGANLHDLEVSSHKTITFLVEMSNSVDVYYTRCTSTCKSVLHTVMAAAGFHLDGFDDIAISELAKLGEVSTRMASVCQELVEKVNAGVVRVEGIHERCAVGVKVQQRNMGVVLEQLPVDIDQKKKKLDFEASGTGVEKRYNNSAKVRDTLSVAAADAGGFAAGVTTEIGLKAGTLAISMPVGVPSAILAATGALLFACSKVTSDMNVLQAADEARLVHIRREEAQAQKELFDLTHKLRQMEDMDIDHIFECLHQVKGQLNMLNSTLVAWKTFWEKLATIFFPRQQETEERFVDYAKLDKKLLQALISGKGFKQMLIHYLARWVAFQEHCRESQARIQANIGPLHQLMERNPTTREARAELAHRAQAVGEKLAIDEIPKVDRERQRSKFVPADGKLQITRYVKNGIASGNDPLKGKQMRATNFVIAVAGPEGRTLSFSDNSVILEIPKDAITKPTVVYCFRRIESSSEIGSTNIIPYAIPVECNAEGRRFDKPVKLKFRHFIFMDDIENTGALKPLTRRGDSAEWFEDDDDKITIEGEWAILTTYHFCAKNVGVQVASDDEQESTHQQAYGHKLPRQQAHMSTILASEEFDEKHRMPKDMQLLTVIMAWTHQMQPFVFGLTNADLPSIPRAEQWRMRKEALQTKGIDPLKSVTVRTHPELYRILKGPQEFCQRQLRGLTNRVESVHFEMKYALGDEGRGDDKDICRIKMEHSCGDPESSILHQPDHRVKLQDHKIVVLDNPTPTAAENDGIDEWTAKYGVMLD